MDGNNGYECFNDANQGMIQSHGNKSLAKWECAGKIHFKCTGKCRDETCKPDAAAPAIFTFLDTDINPLKV